MNAKRKMFFHMVLSSLIRRKSRMFIALLAIIVGATVLFGLTTIYYDIPRQMGSEFRNYGANMILLPSGNDELTKTEVTAATSEISSSELLGYTPYKYQSVRIHEQPIIAAGTDFTTVSKTSPYWYVDGEIPQNSSEALLGKNVSDALSLSVGSSFTAEYHYIDALGESQMSELDFKVAGIVETGGSEEDYLYVSMDDLTTLCHQDYFTAHVSDTQVSCLAYDFDFNSSKYEGTIPQSGEAMVGINTANALGLSLGDTFTLSYTMDKVYTKEYKVSSILKWETSNSDYDRSENNYIYFSIEDETIIQYYAYQDKAYNENYDVVEMSVSANSTSLEAYKMKIEASVTGVSAKLVTRLTASEGTVLTKLQSLILLVTLIVMALTIICVATTMNAVINERRKEIALCKSLGASNKDLIMEFMTEGLFLGLAGGIVGSFVGWGFAEIVSFNVFASSVTFLPWLLPVTLLVSVLVTGLSSLLPIRNAIHVNAAVVLKGE